MRAVLASVSGRCCSPALIALALSVLDTSLDSNPFRVGPRIDRRAAELLSLLAAHAPLTSLSLISCRLCPDEIPGNNDGYGASSAAVSAALAAAAVRRSDATLRTLNLDGARGLGEGAACSLFRAIGGCGGGGGDVDTSPISAAAGAAVAAQPSCALTSLNLGGIGLGSRGLAALAACLRSRGCPLERLALRGCGAGPGFGEAVARAIDGAASGGGSAGGARIAFLNLRSCALGDAGACCCCG